MQEENNDLSRKNELLLEDKNELKTKLEEEKALNKELKLHIEKIKAEQEKNTEKITLLLASNEALELKYEQEKVKFEIEREVLREQNDLDLDHVLSELKS